MNSTTLCTCILNQRVQRWSIERLPSSLVIAVVRFLCFYSFIWVFGLFSPAHSMPVNIRTLNRMKRKQREEKNINKTTIKRNNNHHLYIHYRMQIHVCTLRYIDHRYINFQLVYTFYNCGNSLLLFSCIEYAMCFLYSFVCVDCAWSNNNFTTLRSIYQLMLRSQRVTITQIH